MSIFVSRKYVNALGPRLERFSSKGNDTWAFRCPLCGDSKKSPTKCRGHIYRKQNELFYRCFNCGISTTFGKFLHDVAPDLSKQFVFDLFVDKKGVPEKETILENMIDKMKEDNARLHNLNMHSLATPIEKLDVEHYARKYVESRKIPKESWKYLWFTDDFKKVVLDFSPDRAKDMINGESRLLITTLSENGEITGCAARSFDPNSARRYIHIKTSDKYTKIFGIDRLKSFKDNIFVFEGPIDSSFFPDSLATCDSDLSYARIVYDKLILVFDNQPRNIDLVKTIKRSIEKGFQVCLFPESNPYKDINDMVLGGMNLSDIRKEILDHTYQGMRAELALSHWRKN